MINKKTKKNFIYGYEIKIKEKSKWRRFGSKAFKHSFVPQGLCSKMKKST